MVSDESHLDLPIVELPHQTLVELRDVRNISRGEERFVDYERSMRLFRRTSF